MRVFLIGYRRAPCSIIRGTLSGPPTRMNRGKAIDFLFSVKAAES